MTVVVDKKRTDKVLFRRINLNHPFNASLRSSLVTGVPEARGKEIASFPVGYGLKKVDHFGIGVPNRTEGRSQKRDYRCTDQWGLINAVRVISPFNPRRISGSKGLHCAQLEQLSLLLALPVASF